MTYVALALVGLCLAVVSALSALIRSRDRQHARERELLLNKLLHLAGRPWLEAPADEARDGRRQQLGSYDEPGRYVATPETMPEDWS